MFCVIEFEDLEYFNLTLIQNNRYAVLPYRKDLEYFNLTLIQNDANIIYRLVLIIYRKHIALL